MDYEKKYKDAVSAIKFLLYKSDRENLTADKYREELESIIHELKESDDESIRKFIIKIFKDSQRNGVSQAIMPEQYDKIFAWLEKQGKKETDEWKEGNIIRRGGILALVIKGRRVMKSNGEIFTVQYPDEWVKAVPNEIEHFLNELEKQGEQKPTDKVEPKFKVGDYVVGKYISGYISEVRDDCYLLDYKGFPIDKQDNYHLWTIEDAKDGDVLACESGWTCIFKSLNDDTFSSYCFMDNTKWFCETGSECHTLKEEFVKAYNGKIYPATKEQRDLLFQKMKEAGYEWDADKRELKKIEQNTVWSEEDEKTFSRICGIIHHAAYQNCDTDEDGEYAKIINWFKSLKDRVQPQPMQQWSNEDMNTLGFVIDYLSGVCRNASPYEDVRGLCRAIGLLESVRYRVAPQPQQELSEEDVAVFENVKMAICSCFDRGSSGKIVSWFHRIFAKSLRNPSEDNTMKILPKWKAGVPPQKGWWLTRKEWPDGHCTISCESFQNDKWPHEGEENVLYMDMNDLEFFPKED